MKIHLVGGFTGSGKTTAINKACRRLKDKNISSSFIKDDQVDFVVDNRPAQKTGIPFAKITGGCFCCNYNQLEFQISQLKKEFNPAVIFAEYSGTCTNLITSLLKPLREYKRTEIELVNFSTFVDAQLLLWHFQGVALPLSTENKYIWEKHIQEAEILIVNKMDLLSDCELEALELFVKDHFSSKHLLLQDSFDIDSIDKWLEMISRSPALETNVTDNNYNKYSAGDTDLALLDEEIEMITADNSAVEIAYGFMNKLSDSIVQRMLKVEHLQFFLSYNGQASNFSYKALLEKNTGANTFEKSYSVDLLINARVHTSPDELRKILFDVLNQFKSLKGVTIKEKFISYFQP